MGIENPVHLLFVAVIALIVLGPRRLPELTRALGKGVREFREAIGQGASQPPEAPMGQPLVARAPAQPEASAVAHAGDQPVAVHAADQPVDPAGAVRSGDAPDRRPL